MSDESYIFKIVVGGAGGVGKTTLLHRFLNNVFVPNSTMTIGVAFHSKEIVYQGLQKKIKLSLWDLGGQQRFRFLQSSYSTGARAGIVFFDMTRLDTMQQVKDWVEMFRSHASPGIPIVLGGTKLDIVDPSMVEEIDGFARETAAQLGMPVYVPTSSLTGTGVGEIFKYIIDLLIVQSQDAKEKQEAARSTE
nr:Rab family GTPase [Candidatus Sigynarchaeum springense]